MFSNGIDWLLSTSTCYKYLVVTNGQTWERGDLFDPNCATRVILDRIGDKWTALVVLRLKDGPRRFTELRDGIGQVAPKVLTQTLRRLERDGLVTREIFAEVPPRVVYALTPMGESLIEPITAVSNWAEEHVPAITRAQEKYDASA